jgi:PHD/YefM family antitoxin component YafN of YafNO toxin-antitoxin module
MSHEKTVKEAGAVYAAPTANLERPLILEQDGKPIAVLMSMADYGRYQNALQAQAQLSAAEARRKADKALFDDLVGCALSSGDPQLASGPAPHWRVPYRFLDGTLVAIIEVDAHTGDVSLTDSQRNQILSQVEKLANQHAPTKSA